MSGNLKSAGWAVRKAEALARKGELDKAISIYRAVLEIFPGNKRAAEGLKFLKRNNKYSSQISINANPNKEKINHLIDLYHRKKFLDALDQGKLLANEYPNSPLILNIIGAVNSALGRLERAVASYRSALQIDPNFADAYNNLGAVLIAQGKFSEAIANLNRALQLKPNYADAYNNLGNALKAIGNSEEAVASYTKAAHLKPDSPEVHNNRGVALMALDRHDDALTSLNRAIQLKPDYAEAHYNSGNVLKALGRSEEAIASYKEALKLKPDLAEAYCSLGVALIAIGKIKDAIESLTTALKLKPNYAEAHRSLSLFTTYKEGDPRIAQMLEQIADPGISENDKINLRFALGKAYDDLSDIESAFLHFQEGNRLRRATLQYDISSDTRIFGAIKSIFEADNLPKIDRIQRANLTEKRSIFVVGMLRSGTTLIEQILASHTQIHGAGEIDAMNRIAISALNEIQNDHSGKLTFDVVEKVNRLYLSEIQKLGDNRPFIVDKMPINFLYIGFILCAIPNAKIVNLQRNPAANCWSIYTQYFPGNGNGYAYDLVDIARFYRLYSGLMDFWRGRFPNQIYDVCYEALTENQAAETKKLLEYCGLDWEDQCLEFYKTKREVNTASAAQVRQKMYKGSSEVWKKYAAQIESMIKVLEE